MNKLPTRFVQNSPGRCPLAACKHSFAESFASHWSYLWQKLLRSKINHRFCFPEVGHFLHVLLLGPCCVLGGMGWSSDLDVTRRVWRLLWENAKVSHKRVFALLTPEIHSYEMAQVLQKPVFALPGCQRMSVNTLLCDTLALADLTCRNFQNFSGP